VKYKAAVEQWVRRWHVFTALYDLAENVEPTNELVQLFTGFMYKNRQRSSRSGRQGLGDSMAEMAQHILAQRVFPRLGLEGWTELSEAELKKKAAPFRATIAQTWLRLKRALPEMQSAAHPFVKSKWDERAYFMVQDALYGQMDDGVINYDVGSSDLMVLAVIRATCSRPGAVGKDAFDLSGAISKWARDGENVMRCAPVCAPRGA